MLQSPYAQLLAATTLTKLVCRANITLPLEQRVEISKLAIFVTRVAHEVQQLIISVIAALKCKRKMTELIGGNLLTRPYSF